MLRDIDIFVKGINAYLDANQLAGAPWTRNDVYAVNALKGQFLGQGGGDEARRSQFLDGLQDAARRQAGIQGVFNDLRQFTNPRSVTSVNGKFPYGRDPASGTRAASCSTTAASPPTAVAPAGATASARRREPSQRQQRADGHAAGARPPGIRSWSAARRSATSSRGSSTRSTCTPRA